MIHRARTASRPAPVRSCRAILTLALLGGLFLLSALPGQAQNQRVVHQTINLPDSLGRIVLDVDSAYQAESWPMNTMLVESKVKLYDCGENILPFLIESGRYELMAEQTGKSMRVSINEQERDPLKQRGGGCIEEVERKFYMPAGYVADSLGVWNHPDRLPAAPPVLDPGAPGLTDDTPATDTTGMPVDTLPPVKENRP